ncbi:unnamed protein product [Ectocarpus sp. 12 AP-2014]
MSRAQRKGTLRTLFSHQTFPLSTSTLLQVSSLNIRCCTRCYNHEGLTRIAGHYCTAAQPQCYSGIRSNQRRSSSKRTLLCGTLNIFSCIDVQNCSVLPLTTSPSQRVRTANAFVGKPMEIECVGQAQLPRIDPTSQP